MFNQMYLKASETVVGL